MPLVQVALISSGNRRSLPVKSALRDEGGDKEPTDDEKDLSF